LLPKSDDPGRSPVPPGDLRQRGALSRSDVAGQADDLTAWRSEIEVKGKLIERQRTSQTELGRPNHVHPSAGR
jgi:hypothetical protein